MIPTAGPTNLHHVYGELIEPGRQQDQLLGASCRPGDSTQVVAENPRNQSELFLTADGTHHRAELPVELGSTQQVGVSITDFGDTGATGVHLSQQGPAPKRVVHHLSLQSHADQSTSVPGTRMCDRSDTFQILDTALSGGRLSMTEHAERVTTATNAAALGELCSRVRDLQTATHPYNVRHCGGIITTTTTAAASTSSTRTARSSGSTIWKRVSAAQKTLVTPNWRRIYRSDTVSGDVVTP